MNPSAGRGMRVFLSTGEASGDMSAAALVEQIRALEPAASFAGIGSERMRGAGVGIVAETRGWASMGPIEALGKIPGLYAAMLHQAFALRARPVDCIVLVDFGAFNLRLAKTLRRLRYANPIVYFFPPGAWLDNADQARAVAAATRPLTPFDHQREFYRSLGLETAYFGHPLVSLVHPREPRDRAPDDGGTVALLPGSRRGEIARHLPILFATVGRLRELRPRLAAIAGAADADAERRIASAVAAAGIAGIEIVRGAREAFERADVALVASGTAVLEAALCEVPTVALYIVGKSQERIARRIYHRVFRRPFVTLPNIVLDRPAIPELLLDAATPENLAGAAESLLRDPGDQLTALRELRERLGPPDALERCARYVVEVAKTA